MLGFEPDLPAGFFNYLIFAALVTAICGIILKTSRLVFKGRSRMLVGC